MDSDLATAPLRVGALSVDPDRYVATFRGRVLPLRSREFEILAFLVRNRHRVHSREDLADAVGAAHGRSVDVMLSSIRAAMGVPFVRNVRGRGWIVRAEALDGDQA